MSDYDDPRRDLVKEGCLFCKKTESEAADDVEFVPVGEDEQICTPCLRDSRQFKRNMGWQILISSNFPEDVATEATAAANQALQEVLADHYDDFELKLEPMRISNAERQEDPADGD